MPENMAPDYADKIADEVLRLALRPNTTLMELLAAAAREGYILGLGVNS